MHIFVCAQVSIYTVFHSGEQQIQSQTDLSNDCQSEAVKLEYTH